MWLTSYKTEGVGICQTLAICPTGGEESNMKMTVVHMARDLQIKAKEKVGFFTNERYKISDVSHQSTAFLLVYLHCIKQTTPNVAHFSNKTRHNASKNCACFLHAGKDNVSL